MDDFIAKTSGLAASHLPEDRRIGQLKQVDPAEKLLELKVCDPAMGSGHFLVNLVDHLADRVITAMAEAEALVDDYISPLTERIDVIRNTIIDNAEKRGWAVDAEQLDDRHIVRRMVLKRCVYGVDKNPMAVELAKVAPATTPCCPGGDVNLYSLFVERAMTLVKPDGMVGLLTPSGIASDKTASRFFKGVATEGRLRALYDFENKKVFFPDVHASFKFCVFVASPSPFEDPARCAFYLHSVDEIDDSERCFPLTAADFARVNPNTGTAPIFRSRRDAELTTTIYSRLPVLVDRSSGKEVKAWPVKYSTMFHMTNDSGLFRTREELEEKEGAYPIGGNRFDSATGEWLPLYEGKMVQAFDHRAASVVVNPENQHRPAQPDPATPEQHQNATRNKKPQERRGVTPFQGVSKKERLTRRFPRGWFRGQNLHRNRPVLLSHKTVYHTLIYDSQ